MSWQSDLRDEVRKAQEHRDDLKKKLDEAIDRLGTIASGWTYTNEMPETGTPESKARRTAAIGLERISKMQERKFR